jgi:hypothetical protein
VLQSRLPPRIKHCLSGAVCALPITPMAAVSLSRSPIGALMCAVGVIVVSAAGARALGFSGLTSSLRGESGDRFLDNPNRVKQVV